MRTSAAVRTLYRPAVVSEFQKASVDSTRSRWQAYKIMTWVLTGAAGGIMLSQTYPASDASQGRHALSGVQEHLRNVYESFVLSSVEPQPPGNKKVPPEV